MKRELLLFISDLQIPYHHPDSFAFLKAVKDKYKPTRVFNVGDLIDSHTLSFHEIDPDAMGAGDEIKAAKKHIVDLGKIFPQMDIALGNHDIRMFRKAKAAGIPKACIRQIHSVLGCPEGWRFEDTFKITTCLGDKLLMIHSCGHSDPIKGVQSYGASIVQGHYHTSAEVRYLSNHDKLMFGMTVGCLIDTKALAFEYNKLQLKRPIMSIGLVDNGVPKIIPMRLKNSGRWDKHLD